MADRYVAVTVGGPLFDGDLSHGGAWLVINSGSPRAYTCGMSRLLLTTPR